MQQNSTARAIVNKALLGLGIADPIATDALFATGLLDQFGNISTLLDKYQQQAVTFYDIFHQQLAMTMNKPFLFRKFTFTTVAATGTSTLTGVGNNASGVSDYTIGGIIVEGFRANSFFNVTYGAGSGNRLRVLPYEQYNQMYARPDIVPIGQPQYIVPLPSDGSPNVTLRVIPIPDLVYTIEGQCRFLVPPLKAGSDRCVFPYSYEHPLVMKLMEIMETRLNEGREQNARLYAEEFVAELMREASGAAEETDQLDCGFVLWGGRRLGDSARDYNPGTDVVPPYS